MLSEKERQEKSAEMLKNLANDHFAYMGGFNQRILEMLGHSETP